MKLLWFVSSLEQKGGGERFALEAVQALREQGHCVWIVCDRLTPAASFDGLYDLSEVISTEQHFDGSAAYLVRVLRKLRGIFALQRVIRELAPDLVVCQSEFDAIKLYILSSLLGFPYRVFVFGQMYQFKTDITRYSSVFREHLQTIVASRPGYRDTVQLPPPKLPLITLVVNELISRLKLRALTQADRVFTLSGQVRWEVGLVYRKDATVCRAAFNESFINRARLSNATPVSTPLRLLSVSRLVDKKRIDLTVEGFSRSRVPAVLHIVGTGPEELKLKALASASPRAKDIRFLGAVDDATLQQELAAADCFISMDIGDYDISVVEAMGQGLRVLVAADFDLTDFGPEFTGAMSVEPNPLALATAIDTVATLPPPGPANLKVLESLTWQSLARTVATT
jgi:glycosyltransferase involved in cell wall biosynthesis